MHRTLPLFLPLATLATTVAAQPTVSVLEPSGSYLTSWGDDIAGGLGATVACTGFSEGVSGGGGGPRCTYWSPVEGLLDVHELLDLRWDFSWGEAISADGSTVIVRAYDQFGSNWRFRWSVRDGLLPEPSLPAGWRIALLRTLTRDGRGFAGSGINPAGASRGVRWLDGVGLTDLGVLPGAGSSSATAMSQDGRVVVGSSGSSSRPQAFRWVDGSGMQALGALPGHVRSLAAAVSADGRMVAGTSGPSGAEHGFIWTAAEGMIDLEQAPQQTFSPRRVSADGAVIIGTLFTRQPNSSSPCVWTRAGGRRPLAEFLRSLGVDVAGWTFDSLNGMSADASVLTGYGSIGGRYVGFVVTGLPAHPACPADVTHDGFLDFVDYTVYLDRFESGTPGADFNDDGFVDFFDYSEFVAAFETGC